MSLALWVCCCQSSASEVGKSPVWRVPEQALFLDRH